MREKPALQQFRELLARLLAGPAPRGDEFDLCRLVLTKAPASEEALAAARALFEGAMADARTDVADAQLVMVLLKAVDRGELSLREIVGGELPYATGHPA